LAGVAASDELVEEGAIGDQVGEVRPGAQQERVGDGSVEVAVWALNRSVLVCQAGIVAGECHALGSAHGLAAAGEIFLCGRVEGAEGDREAVGSVLAGHAAERPEGILQPFGDRHEALAAEHDVGVLEAGVVRSEAVEPLVGAQAGDGDAETGPSLKSDSPEREPASRAQRRVHDEAVREALIVLWEASDRICGKRMKALIPTLLPAMERHGHVALVPECLSEIILLSE
jgi:hypothetical protein